MYTYDSVVSIQSILLYTLSELLGVLCLAVQSPSSRKVVFCILLGVAYFQLYHTKIEMIGFSAQYGIGCRLASIMCIVFEGVFKKDAMRGFRWVGGKKDASGRQVSRSGSGKVVNDEGRSGNGHRHEDSKKSAKETDITTAPFRERFFWAISLYCNPRGIGWAHESPTLPKRPTSWNTRLGLIRSQAIYLLLCWVIHDLNLTLMRRNPYFTLGLTIPEDSSIIFKALLLLHRGVGEALLVATGLTLNIDSFCLVCVALGLTDLASNRPIFGSIFDAYTIQNLWSKTWHQFFRRPFLLMANTLADMLYLPKRTKPRSYFILFTVFGVSCILHTFGDFVLVGSWKETKAWTFFMPQVAGIWFETIVIQLGRKLGIRKSFATTMLGYAWVLIWFSIVMGPMTESHAKEGFYADRFEISFVDGLLNGQWYHYPHTKTLKW